MQSIAEYYGYIIFDLVDSRVRKFIPYKYDIAFIETMEIIAILHHN